MHTIVEACCGEEPFDDCTTGEPSERIVLGGSDVPVGVSEALYDMEIGEERTVIIPCEKAYGLHDSQGVQRYARSFIAGGDTIRRRRRLRVETPCFRQKRTGKMRGNNERHGDHRLQSPACRQGFGILVQVGGCSGRQWCVGARAVSGPRATPSNGGRSRHVLSLHAVRCMRKIRKRPVRALSAPQTTCLACGCVFDTALGACPECGVSLWFLREEERTLRKGQVCL